MFNINKSIKKLIIASAVICSTSKNIADTQNSCFADGLWTNYSPEGLDYCRTKLEQAYSTSGQELKEKSFTSEQYYQDVVNSFKMAQRAAGKATGKELENTALLQDLRIFSANETNALRSVHQKLFGKNGISPLKTPQGQTATMLALLEPTTDLSVLNKRRELIQSLVNNPELLAKIKTALDLFAEAQAKSYNLILNPAKAEPFNPLKHKSLSQWLEVKDKVFDVKCCSEFDSNLVNFVAKFGANHFIQKYSMELNPKLLKAYGTIPSIKQMIETGATVPTETYKTMGQFIALQMATGFVNSTNYFKKLDKYLPMSEGTAINLNMLVDPILGNNGYTGLPMVDVMIQLFLPQIKIAVLEIVKDKNISIKDLPKILKNPMEYGLEYGLVKRIAIALSVCYSMQIIGYLKSIKKIQGYVPHLKQARARLQNLRAMLQSAAVCEGLLFGQAQETKNLLSSNGSDSFGSSCWPMLNTFQSDANDSSFFNYGNVIATFNYLNKGIVDQFGQTVWDSNKINLDQLTKLMQKVGEIDLCAAIAGLVVNTKDQENQFCIAEFVDSQNAVFKAQNSWNLMFDQNVAVANSISIGLDSESSAQGAIVTAGNACGKSVLITSYTVSAYLSQCLGVAPAKELIMTPFDKFFTQMNTIDDPLKDRSLFRAQIRQLGEVAEKILRYSSEGKKVFLCMDESLSGTKPKYATALLGSIIAEVLAPKSNYVMLFATHLEDLAGKIDKLSTGKIMPVRIVCQLEKDGHFKNSTFKSTAGASSIDSAFKVAEEEWSSLFPEEDCSKFIQSAKTIFGSPTLA